MIYKVVVNFLKILMHLVFRIKTKGKENILKDGPCIICSNHICLIDPVTIAISSKRQVYFMGKKQLFKNWFVNIFFRSLGAFPVDRESSRDIEAYRKSINILKEGKILGIFFQGKRMHDLDEKSAKAGVAMFALKGKAPIIPVSISGEYKLFGKLYINFGEPIYITQYEGEKIKQELLAKITDNITLKILELGKE